MSQTTVERRKDSLIVYRIAELENDIRDLRTNQTQKLGFGNIVIDGTTGNGVISSNGTGVLNGNGLTYSNFPNSQVIGGGISTGSTSFVDVPGSTMTPFLLSQSTTVLVSLTVFGANANYTINDSTMQVQVVDSIAGSFISIPLSTNWRLTGISQNGAMAIVGWSMNTDIQSVGIADLVSFGAGTHTLKLQYKVNGNGSAEINTFILSYVIIGAQV